MSTITTFVSANWKWILTILVAAVTMYVRFDYVEVNTIKNTESIENIEGQTRRRIANQAEREKLHQKILSLEHQKEMIIVDYENQIRVLKLEIELCKN